jgi:Fe-S oxidoreductase
MACGRCNDACPATAAAEPLKPKELVQSLRKWMSHGHGASPFGELVTEEAVWACTLCQACAFECPPLCGPSDLIVALRRQWVAAGERGELPRNLQHAATNESGAAGRPNLFGAATAQPPTSWDVQPVALLSGEERSRFGGSLTLPAGVATVLRHLRETGNPWGCPAAERTRWAEGLDVPLLRDHPTAKVLYWVGCAAAYEERAQAVARAMVHLLRQAGVDFAILGAEETCTGDAARRLGDEALFQRLAAANVATLNNYRVRCIVTACPHCFNTLRHEYPVMGGKYEVIHHTALLSDLAGVGRLRVLGGSCTPDPGGRVTYHDPCHLGRINGVLDSPRALLDAAGAERVEMAHHGPDSACCGAGGGRVWLDGASPGPITHRRLAEARATGAPTLVTACPFCLLQIGQADTGGLVVRDVAEVVAGMIREA